MICQLLIVAIFAAAPPFDRAQPDALPPQDILRTAETDAAIQYRFSDDDQKLLDAIQRGCFNFFIEQVGRPALLVKDRLKGENVSSIAAVGYQLSALPIGVERGWIKREDAESRALTILRALVERRDNKKWGVYLHFPDADTGGMSTSGYELGASTIDTALLFAGAMPAATYFGGDVAKLVERMLDEADWTRYRSEHGVLNMGWGVKDKQAGVDGPGEFYKHYWWAASSEEQIIYFLAVGSPNAAHALKPEEYYQPRRHVKQYKDGPPFVPSVTGSLFHYFFSHTYIDFRPFEADAPKRFGVDLPRVWWMENSRRAVLTHRLRCVEMKDQFTSFSNHRWGQTACVGKTGYIVPIQKPNLIDRDDFHEGTIAPYAAGCSIMFTPRESMEALRAFRDLKTASGKPVWKDPNEGGYGLAYTFNLDQDFVCDDVTAIEVGPLLLAIENVRTGLTWKLFMEHPAARRAVERLGWERRSG